MTRQIKHLFSKERVSVLLKKKKIFNKQGPSGPPRSGGTAAQQKQNEVVLPVRSCAIGSPLDKERAPQNRTENRSQYGIRLREFKKIMNLYTNISKKYLKTRIKLFHNTPTKMEENFFRYLESRLDVILCRASFFDSICSARQAIRSGEVLVNRIAVKTPAQILKPGDLVCLLQKEDSSYFRNTKRLNKEILSPLKKVETLLFENALTGTQQSLLRSCVKKKKDHLSLQSLIDFILSSTRTEAFSPFRKINLSEKKIAFNYLTRRSQSGARSGSSLTNTTSKNTSNTNTYTTKLCSKLCSKLYTCENLFKNNLPSYAKDILSCNFLRQPKHNEVVLAQQKKVKIENSRFTIIKKPLSSFNPDLTNEDCFIVLNYYLYLKRVLQKNWTVKQGHSFKSTKIFKKGKPAHLEVSYTSLSIVFLFPPQFIKFSDFINYSDIFK